MVTVTVEAEVDLDDFDDEDIRAEADRRGLELNADVSNELDALLKRALDMLHGGRTREVINILEKELYPKWKDEHTCQLDYEQAMKAKKATAEVLLKGNLPRVMTSGGHAL